MSMDYKEKYEAIVGWLKKYADEGMNITPSDIRISVPELAESEDERIRKIMIKYFRGSIGLGVAIDGISVKDIVAYLEKQKEQKPAGWSEEDEKKINSIIFKLQHDGGLMYEKEITFLKSLRPQPHWKPSVEQMLALGGVLDYLEESDNEDADIVRELINDLKKL